VRDALEAEGITIAADPPEKDLPRTSQGGEVEIGDMPLGLKDPG
jgi:UPF0271 protein